MNANTRESTEKRSLDALAHEVIGAIYEVSNVLGCGFLEKVYERALSKELTLRGLKVQCQVPFSINYKGEVVGIMLPTLSSRTGSSWS